MKIRLLAMTALALTVGSVSLTAATLAQTTPAPAAQAQTAAPAPAAWNVDAITAKYQAEGYTRIEVEVGTRWARVEAFKDGSKTEDTYDVSSGEMIRTETSQVSADDDVTPGVFVSQDDDDHGGENQADDGDHDGGDDSGHDRGNDKSGDRRGHDD